jgi:glycosyltransferase involved in cell wall biosynthesis
VHIHSSLAGLIVRICLLPVRRRPKLIYTPHAWSFSPGATRNVWFRRTCERVLSLWTDRIVCVSDDEMRLALDAGISQARCAVVLTGISSHVAAKTIIPGPEQPSRRRRILFVGRFDRQKGFDIYLEVMRLLGHRAEGVVAGAAIVGKPMDIPIPPNVRMLGWRSPDQVLDLYREADLLLMPSRFEGLPMVALEAMQAGVPIFASNAGPMRELVEDGVSGRLFPGAPPDEIAAEIATTSDEQLRRFGQRGHEIFQRRFTAERMNCDMLEVYRLLCETGASNTPVETEIVPMLNVGERAASSYPN